MSVPIHEYGKFGGRVLRSFKADIPYIEGAEISAEVAMRWPFGNRKALFEMGKIEWYGPPEDAEKRLTAATNAAKEKKPKAEKTENTPSVKSSRRTK